MTEIVLAFVVGIIAGVAIHRLLMAIVLEASQIHSALIANGWGKKRAATRSDGRGERIEMKRKDPLYGWRWMIWAMIGTAVGSIILRAIW